MSEIDELCRELEAIVRGVSGDRLTSEGLDRIYVLVGEAVRQHMLPTSKREAIEKVMQDEVKCACCSTLFWRKSKRQKYCSHKCANLSSVRAFYKRMKDR